MDYWVVIGATGKVSGGSAGVAMLHKWGYSKPLFLASVSSSDVEYRGLLEMPELELSPAWRAVDSPSSRYAKVFGDYICKDDDGHRFTLMSRGHPVNFNGDIEHIDKNVIECTRALMLAGVCVGIANPGRGKRLSRSGFRAAELAQWISVRSGSHENQLLLFD
ncbi:MAG: hypothetical protein DHS20C15_12870 [Planctomycetota bacterium]|nr:MAG: hypothetical protein DHS20C15_12870 [Planctomycetota bacterium]